MIFINQLKNLAAPGFLRNTIRCVYIVQQQVISIIFYFGIGLYLITTIQSSF